MNQAMDQPKNQTTRREFLKGGLCATCGAWLFLSPWSPALAGSTFNPSDPHLREAYFYEKLKSKGVQCKTCPNRCLIKKGKCAFCKQPVRGRWE